jgi:hypothetical protein
MARVRVMRIIEIEYPSQEAYEADRERWMLPANGTKSYGTKTYKTATFLSESIGDRTLIISDGKTASDQVVSDD